MKQQGAFVRRMKYLHSRSSFYVIGKCSNVVRSQGKCLNAENRREESKGVFSITK